MPKTIAPTLLLAALPALAPAPAAARVHVHFTARGDDVPEVIRAALRQAERRAAVGRPATIDAAVFSFTDKTIADELLRIAHEQPAVQVRLILDLSQISLSESHMGPYLENVAIGRYADACKAVHGSSSRTSAARRACKDDLTARFSGETFSNIVVKYKWYDAYEWNASARRAMLSHGRSLLMHRKALVVNGDTLVTGSYNWSPAAANENYENLFVASGTAEWPLIDQARAEFEAMWSDAANFKPGDEVRALRREIFERLERQNAGR